LPLPKATTTTPSCSGRARSSMLPSSPTTSGTSATRARSPSGRTVGGRAGGTAYTTRPSSTFPTAAACGAENAAESVACIFTAVSPAKIRPANTTIAPRPALAGLAATRAASSRFFGPSHPSSLEVRMAPVMATGRPVGSVRARMYAVSSIVSVPWVTTIPAASPASAISHTRSRRAQSRSGPRWQAGSLAQFSMR
jgi:hypothetical protein